MSHFGAGQQLAVFGPETVFCERETAALPKVALGSCYGQAERPESLFGHTGRLGRSLLVARVQRARVIMLSGARCPVCSSALADTFRVVVQPTIADMWLAVDQVLPAPETSLAMHAR